MTQNALENCLRKLEARAHVMGLIWNDAVADSFGSVIADWEDEFGEEVVNRALGNPFMPMDLGLRTIAADLRGYRHECLTEIPKVQHDGTDHRRTRREAFALGALDAWERMYPEGSVNVPEWVAKARNFLEGLSSEAEYEPFFQATEMFFNAEKRRQIISEVRAHNNKQTEMTEL